MIECFDVEYDTTECAAGIQMAQLYARLLDGRSQKEIFFQVAQGLRNIEVIEGDFKTAVTPSDAICFAFVNENQEPEYVRNGFCLVWGKLTPSGVMTFHDYGYDLPQVTGELHKFCAQYGHRISSRFVHEKKQTLFIQKWRARGVLIQAGW